jgi:hypothetical protein
MTQATVSGSPGRAGNAAGRAPPVSAAATTSSLNTLSMWLGGATRSDMRRSTRAATPDGPSCRISRPARLSLRPTPLTASMRSVTPPPPPPESGRRR